MLFGGKMELKILKEDRDIIVAVKPAGIPTQSGRISEPDCVSILKNHLADGHGEPYLGLVHRLDQPVEGIGFFKTRKAAAVLSGEAAGTAMEKQYLARLNGVPERAQDTLTSWLCRDTRTNSSSAVPEGTPGAKRAVLSYRILGLEADGLFSLAEIRIQSGRHLNPVQMAELGHPIDGDRKYASRESGGVLKLCAYRLRFHHPVSGQTMDFQIRPSWLSEEEYRLCTAPCQKKQEG